MRGTRCIADHAMDSLFPQIILLEIFFTMTTLAFYDLKRLSYALPVGYVDSPISSNALHVESIISSWIQHS